MIRRLLVTMSLVALGGFGAVRAQSNDMGSSGQSADQQQKQMAQNAQGNVSQTDQDFAVKAHQANLAEIKAGQLAQQRAANNEVKQFAQRIVDDHTNADNRLQQIATQKGIKLPNDVDQTQKADQDQLSQLSGTAFDQAFVRNQMRDHQKAMSLFQSEASNGQDPDLKSFASSTISALQQHGQMANSIQSRIGASASSTSPSNPDQSGAAMDQSGINPGDQSNASNQSSSTASSSTSDQFSQSTTTDHSDRAGKALPRTGSEWPLVAFVGFLSAGAGFFIRSYRLSRNS
jgi:putative membrane protein